MAKSAGMGYGSPNSGKNGVGCYSSKKNPMPQPSRTPVGVGPGSNPDQQKVNKLLMKSQKVDESLRGMGVM